jgi:hypothetical protein
MYQKKTLLIITDFRAMPCSCNYRCDGVTSYVYASNVLGARLTARKFKTCSQAINKSKYWNSIQLNSCAVRRAPCCQDFSTKKDVYNP